jgi:putative tryptophan/tyrosine transport system substrate-binding protein
VRRREFITLVGGATAWPLAAYSQQPSGPIPQIVYLGVSSPATSDPRQIEQFKVGLAENGLVDGQNIKVDYLWGEGSPERLRQLAANLAQRNLSVIVTVGPQSVRALLEAKVKSPIVFAILNDPISDGFIQSLARPGGNITGLSMSGTDLENKRLEILKDAVPTSTKVMLLHDPSMGPTGLKEARPVARTLGIEILVTDTGDADKIKEAFAGAEAQGINGVAAMASPFFYFRRKQLIELSSQYRLPSIWEAGAFVRDGGLLSYGPNFPDMYRRSAGYVAKIIKGSSPRELPVEQPTRFELAINLQTARTLGLIIPATLISRADEVIE